MKGSLALVSLAAVSAQTHHGDNFNWNIEQADADFTIGKVDFEAQGAHSHTWGPHEDITVTIRGQVNKAITAGTTKWQVYEGGVQHFTDSGNMDYFVCTNKGCDPSQPLSLTLHDPHRVPTEYTLSFSYKTNTSSTGGDGKFGLLVWGQDQTHEYDFSMNITYDYASQQTFEFTPTSTSKQALRAPQVCSPCYEKPPACTGSETSVQITGVTGDFCSPLCVQNECPKGDGSFTAKPSCVLETQGSSKPTQCALICTPGANGACPAGATCQAIQGEGICTYPASL